MSIGARIRASREAKGLTGLVLAEAIDATGSAVSRWEHDKRVPGSEQASALAKALGVSERWLITGEGPREPQPQMDADGTPIGVNALEIVLSAHDWPDLPVGVVDDIVRALREEASTPPGETRPASVWRLRIRQLLGAQSAQLRPKSAASG